jgi:hypothetical protein
MQNRKNSIMKNTIRILCAALMSLLAAPFLHADLLYNVSIDTTPIAGTDGFFAFDLLGGIPFQNNLATITSFTTDSTLGAASTSGDVTGSLVPGPLTLTADQFFNEWLQAVTFGHLTTFVLDVSTNFAAQTTPDSFAFFLLDSTENPLTTSDPTGANSVFAIDLVGANTSPQVYTSTGGPAPEFTATVTPQASGVPEPDQAPLLALCLAGVYGLRYLPKRRRSL